MPKPIPVAADLDDVGVMQHPVQSDADLYVTDLGDAFQREILSEIEMRLAEVSSSDDAESESVRNELEALKAMTIVAEC